MKGSDIATDWLDYDQIKHLITLWKMLQGMAGRDSEAKDLMDDVYKFGYECQQCGKVFGFDTIPEHLEIHFCKYRITEIDNPSRR